MSSLARRESAAMALAKAFSASERVSPCAALAMASASSRRRLTEARFPFTTTSAISLSSP